MLQYDKRLKQFSRALRKNMTDAEMLYLKLLDFQIEKSVKICQELSKKYGAIYSL
jgi:very-short-patch-repair endonuclease